MKQWISDSSKEYLIYFFGTTINDKNFYGICGGGFATKDPKFGELFRSSGHKSQIDNIMDDIKKFDNDSFGLRIDEDLIWRYLGFLNIIHHNNNNNSFYVHSESNITYLITSKITNKKYCIRNTNLILIDL